MFARSPLSNVSLNSCNQIRSESRLTAPAARGSVIKKKNVGRWHEWERLAFLRGLRRFGRGKWKKISKLIPTRDTIQVKTHAQVMLKKLEAGYNIFEELDVYNGNRHSYIRHAGPIVVGGNVQAVVISDELLAAQSLLQLSLSGPPATIAPFTV